MQANAEQQANVPVVAATVSKTFDQNGEAHADAGMDVDQALSPASSSKRKADDELEPEASKKAKLGERTTKRWVSFG